MKEKFIYKSFSLEETNILAKEIVKKYFLKDKDLLIILDGEYSAGKTYLTWQIINNLGCKEIVSSPSFFLKNEYTSKDYKISHFDLYQINDSHALDEAIQLIEEDYLNGRIVFVEWGKVVWKKLKIKNRILIKITIIGESSRKFLVKVMIK